LEETLITSIALPLNIKGSTHPFKPILSAMLSKAIAEPQIMEIADERGLTRRKAATFIKNKTLPIA